MILNYLIDDDVYRMQKIEEQLEKIEENVIGHVQKHLDERIMKYRKHFSELMVSYDQMTNMVSICQLYMNRNESRMKKWVGRVMFIELSVCISMPRR